MSTLSLAEVVNKACELKNKKEKIEWLQKHNSKPLRNILKVMYDKSMVLNIPKTAPPYTPSELPESHGMLYREARKLPYFVKGFDGDNIHPIRREALFIQLLETVDKEDAELLIKMIAQKPLKGLTADVLVEALGDFIPSKATKA
jgi:hypothetical protein